jgi:hypothetical protein
LVEIIHKILFFSNRKEIYKKYDICTPWKNYCRLISSNIWLAPAIYLLSIQYSSPYVLFSNISIPQ